MIPLQNKCLKEVIKALRAIDQGKAEISPETHDVFWRAMWTILAVLSGEPIYDISPKTALFLERMKNVLVTAREEAQGAVGTNLTRSWIILKEASDLVVEKITEKLGGEK